MEALKWLAVVALVAACGKKQPADQQQPTAAKTEAPGDAAAMSPSPTPAPAAPVGEDLLAVTSGVLVVSGPGGLEPTAREWAMLDDDVQSGWITEEAQAFAHPIVLELPTRTRIKSFVVDEGKSDLASRLVHEFDVEVSDESATAGFKPVAHLKPDRQADALAFPVTADVPGRWVRITVLPRKNPDEGVSEVQLMNLHAYGERLAPVPLAQVAGRYESEEIGLFNLTQDGVQISGCAEKAKKPLTGVLDGRVLRLQWEHDAENDHGPMVMVFGDNRAFAGYWNETIEKPSLFPIDAKRTSAKPDPCAKPKQDPLADELATKGRVRLYGINFDTDKDVLRPESKPTLDRIVALLGAKPDLRLKIEGHTDDRGSADHNQTLSDARAASVKRYLTDAGVAADRLETQGFGATKPAVSNTSEMGRAANRRVELVKI